MVRHGHPTRAAVRQDEVLVVKPLAVDAFAPGAVPGRDVSHLQHEVRDDAVHRCVLVVQDLATLLVASGDGRKVHYCHRSGFTEQRDGKAPNVILSGREISGFVGRNLVYEMCGSR